MASASDLLTRVQGDHGADQLTISDGPQPDKSGASTICCTWVCRAVPYIDNPNQSYHMQLRGTR